MDALTKGISLCQLNNSLTPARFEEHAAVQAYMADVLTAAETIRRSECIDRGLHVAICTLTPTKNEKYAIEHRVHHLRNLRNLRTCCSHMNLTGSSVTESQGKMVWQARAEAQAARQEIAKRTEEEGKTAIAQYN